MHRIFFGRFGKNLKIMTSVFYKGKVKFSHLRESRKWIYEYQNSKFVSGLSVRINQEEYKRYEEETRTVNEFNVIICSGLALLLTYCSDRSNSLTGKPINKISTIM